MVEPQPDTGAYFNAASRMNWRHITMEPPCFHLEGNYFCSRPQSWMGHDAKHQFVSLDELLVKVTALAVHESGECKETRH